MPKKVKCCIPGCGNNYKNKGTLRFYRIPKDPEIRNCYRLILRDQRVRLESDGTRICSAHFENGMKLSRTHLPSIFPWTIEEDQKTGEKRKNLENIASVLKTLKKTKTSTSIQDGVDGVTYAYPYHVPWRFNQVPLNNGCVSGFKTNDELLQCVVTPLVHENTIATTMCSTSVECSSLETAVQDYSNSIQIYPTQAGPQDVRVEFKPELTIDVEAQLQQSNTSLSSLDGEEFPIQSVDRRSIDELIVTPEAPKEDRPRVTIYKECACQTEVSEEDFQQMAQKLNAVRYENRKLRNELESLKRSFCNM